MVLGRWFGALRRRFGRRSQEELDEDFVASLRSMGVTIGERCRVYTRHFSSDPYLVSLGDDVAVAGGVQFLTHDGAARLLAHRRPEVQRLGRIRIGNGCFVGQNAIILPGTTIGDGCIVAAGAVVGGVVPPNSLVAGNPGKVMGRASLYLERLDRHPDTIDSFNWRSGERRTAILKHFAERDAAGPTEP